MEQVKLVGIEAVEHGVAVDFAKLGEHGRVKVVGEDTDREERFAVDQRDAFVVERDTGSGGCGKGWLERCGGDEERGQPKQPSKSSPSVFGRGGELDF